MNMKRILVLLLAFAMIFALASCKKCKDHVDKDDDYLCDNCGENFDDGDENVEPEKTTIDVTFVLKLDNGEALEGVKITVSRGEKSYELVSGADGKATVALDPAAYAIDYDYDTLPEFCTPETFGVKIEEGKTSVDLVIVNNLPDGSIEKPFFISENETEITLAPGQEFYFNYRGSSVKTVTVNNSGITVGYNGEIYSAVDGVVEAPLSPEIGKMTVFSVKNVTDSEITTVMALVAKLGSYENPIEISGNGASATVNYETVVYFKWTADKTGTLTLTANSDRNNISITKVMENDVTVVSQTNGSLTETMEVTAGDVITIGVSALEAPEGQENQDIEISFTLNIS